MIRRWQAIADDLAPEAHLFVAGGRQYAARSRYTRIGTRFLEPLWYPWAEPLPERSHVLAAPQEADLRQVAFLEDS